MLPNAETMRDLVKDRARTDTGLKVWVRQIKKKYENGVKASKEFMENSTVVSRILCQNGTIHLSLIYKSIKMWRLIFHRP